MNVIHISASSRGGAGIAAGRSVVALRRQSIQAELWSLDGTPKPAMARSRFATRWRWRLESLPLRIYPRRRLFSVWSNNHLPSGWAAQINRHRPDIVHLHWIGDGLMNLSEIARIQAPVVWTLHDAWAFTGGCHYPDACRRFATNCGLCPQLGSVRLRDLSWINLQLKRRSLRHVSAVISPTRWLAALALGSGAIREDQLHVIPNGVDGEIFRPMIPLQARQELGLAEDAVILTAGAHDLNEYRKGVHLLRETMAILVKEKPANYCMLLFGSGTGRSGENGWPCPTRWVGSLSHGADIARLLSASDAYVLPSLQDNLPNIALEALACGCPVIGFKAGGMPEIVDSPIIGTLAPERTARSLAATLREWLDCSNLDGPRSEVRKSFERRFSLARHGQLLESLYSNICAKSSIAG